MPEDLPTADSIKQIEKKLKPPTKRKKIIK